MRANAKQRLTVLLLLLALQGCNRPTAPDSPKALLQELGHCWPNQVLNAEDGLVRLQVLGIYLPDQGAMALSSNCGGGIILDWRPGTDPAETTLNEFLQTDVLGPHAAGFRADVVGRLRECSGHMGVKGVCLEVVEWKGLASVPPELSRRIESRFDRAAGPI